MIEGPKTQKSISLLMINVRMKPIGILAIYDHEPDGSMMGLQNIRDLFTFL